MNSALAYVPVDRPQAGLAGRVSVHGKFFFRGADKHFLKGVTYGPFGPGSHGAQVPERPMVERDLALMADLGVNTVRVFTTPPGWFLDRCEAWGMSVLVGIPWTQHVAFLDDSGERRRIRDAIRAGVQANAGHKAILGYLVGNEISPDIVRWQGPERIRGFLKDLSAIAKDTDPDALVSYANYPSTEYLNLDFADFLAFNVYLHREADFRNYIMRLHNIAVDRPVVLTEFGMDSMREGAVAQAETLRWQVAAAYELGIAGTCIFSWTDEWFTGGYAIEDWAFGLVTAGRAPKPSFHAVQTVYKTPLPPRLPRYPKVSVVICSYNADRTMDQCLASFEHLNYPNFEVIVVNDGSKDRTLEISESYARKYAFLKIVSQENKGLSVARNVGMEQATGEIVAYTDSDCVVDPDWLTYLVAKMLASDLAAIGGPHGLPPRGAGGDRRLRSFVPRRGRRR